ncbi:low temperature requirement protein LtrA [Rhizoctonia solani]|uniref:Low temperature requirement protein LtrA n=1 Tax=Rhizoctonia solani TaxID=456999 RepID=A0A8H8NYE3_9AGAM|nr:low temperature requirement protein LtrA [Rhizoctonia solani]QRW20603.1 low temperature requirement protein LtrA [Rhizoctonia solani]
MSSQPLYAILFTGWFSGFLTDVDPENDHDNGLTEQRLEQWRPLWQNPFIDPDLGLSSKSDYNPTPTPGGDVGDEKLTERPAMSRGTTSLSKQSSVVKPAKVTHAGPTWVNLFYDLAWTASFASLTQNGKLDGPWDMASYATFFLLVWWLWASQTLYSIHFYTNDWVHLLSTLVQLIIFGLLAATTRGYSFIAYILESPGMDTLDPKTMEEMVDPVRYQEDRITYYSLKVIACSVATSRTILWLQHILVYGFAYFAAREKKLIIPLKLYILPIGLVISNILFWVSAGITCSEKGKTVLGAELKFILWLVGLIVEVALHHIMERLDWERTSFRSTNESSISHDAPPQPVLLKTPIELQQPSITRQQWPVPHTNVNLRERLEGITTVVIGEGLNGIAGTLYSVLSAPGFGGPVAANIACTAIIIYFLAYFYAEGPTGHRNPSGSSVRHMWWMMTHLPFLLGIILLLLGVKNQFIMTSYLSTALKTFRQFDKIMGDQQIALDDPTSQTNMPMKNFLLKRGVVWADEFNQLNETVTNNGTISPSEVDVEKFRDQVGIWNMRISLKIMTAFYTNFMGKDSNIKPSIEARIKEYYVNDTLPLKDWNEEPELPSSYYYESIITELLETHLQGARYIVALAGAIFISLGIMNRIHSKPRDRFQWGIVMSRIFMGFALLILLTLNAGSIQSLWVWDYQEGQQAGVFRWIWAWMVLPTLAIAFGTEFLIELVLLRCSGLAIARKRGRINTSLWRAFFSRPLSWPNRAK